MMGSSLVGWFVMASVASRCIMCSRISGISNIREAVITTKGARVRCGSTVEMLQQG